VLVAQARRPRRADVKVATPDRSRIRGQSGHPARPQGLTKTGAVLGLSVVGALTLGACGSSQASGLLGAQRQQECTAIADVLSDGPDPGADPVGYAEAQILPLRQLHISELKLRSAVDKLASAFQAYSTSSGPAAKADAKKVAADEKALNVLCPGAAS
jgi:hypothetical protein